MAGSIAGLIVAELVIKVPMHALDAPMAACGFGEAFDVEFGRRDIVARFEAAAIGIFDARVHLEDRLDVLEARLTRVASLGGDPIDVIGGRIGAGLDPAMSFLDDGWLADDFIERSGAGPRKR